jgi:hypothetical protein
MIGDIQTKLELNDAGLMQNLDESLAISVLIVKKISYLHHLMKALREHQNN